MRSKLPIISLCVIACVGYGVLHDQITARICVEYFTIGHPPILSTNDPFWLAIGWGVLSTWWFGLLLGVPLAWAASRGPGLPRSAWSFCGPILAVALCTATLAICAGFVAHVAAQQGWIALTGRSARQVPDKMHVAFLVDLWAHVASYIGGAIGGMVLVAIVYKQRRRAAVGAPAATTQHLSNTSQQ